MASATAASRRRWWLSDDAAALTRLRAATLKGDIDDVIAALSPGHPGRPAASAPVCAGACAAATQLAAASHAPWDAVTRRVLACNVTAALATHAASLAVAKRGSAALRGVLQWHGGVDTLADAPGVIPALLRALRHHADDLPVATHVAALLCAFLRGARSPHTLSSRVGAIISFPGALVALTAALRLASTPARASVAHDCAAVLHQAVSHSAQATEVAIGEGAAAAAVHAMGAHPTRSDLAAEALGLLACATQWDGDAATLAVVAAGGVRAAIAAISSHAASSAVCVKAALLLRNAAATSLRNGGALLVEGVPRALASALLRHGESSAEHEFVVHACNALNGAIELGSRDDAEAAREFISAGGMEALARCLQPRETANDEQLAYMVCSSLSAVTDAVVRYVDDLLVDFDVFTHLQSVDILGLANSVLALHPRSARVCSRVDQLRSFHEWFEEAAREGFDSGECFDDDDDYGDGDGDEEGFCRCSRCMGWS